MEIKVIVLNGPPGVGKDTAARALARGVIGLGNSHHYKWMPIRAKERLVMILAPLLGVTTGRINKILANQKLKNEPIFNGMSLRQIMIDLSENFIKSRFGKNYFGQALLQDIKRHKYDKYVISDCGFIEELEPLFDSPNIHLKLIQIHRYGYDYSIDSRGWIELPNKTIVMNDKEPKDLKRKVKHEANRWLDSFNHKIV